MLDNEGVKVVNKMGISFLGIGIDSLWGWVDKSGVLWMAVGCFSDVVEARDVKWPKSRTMMESFTIPFFIMELMKNGVSKSHHRGGLRMRRRN